MAKTLLEFENVLVDVMRIAKVEKTTEWDENAEAYVFKILFNKELPDMSLIRDMEFTYLNLEFRDKKYDGLKRKLESIEHIVLL